MPGEAKTNKFMLGTATVMIGPQADVFDLTPADHSIGLVKNFRATNEPSYTDLTQGVRNTNVYSVMTGSVVKATMEAYEYTRSNLAYALGLEGHALDPATLEVATTADAIVDDTSVTVADESGFAVDDYVILQDGVDDQIYVRKLSAVTAGSLTFVEPLPAALATGTVVRKVGVLSVGSKVEQPYLAAKIVGSLADRTPVAIICPKIRITNGFSLGFTTENFDNLPLEFSFYDLTPSEAHYAEFRNEQAKLFV